MTSDSLTVNFEHQRSPIQQFPVEKGYFRSKLLVTDAFTNPLIAAASPLISILERLHIATELPPLDNLHQDISHEFKAFYCRFHRHDYSEEFHLLANYILSATTDEILGKTYLRLHGEAKQFAAFTPISPNGIGPEQYFFEIIQYLLTLPEQFLDLIELAYFCLLIGFEGQYHLQTDGRLFLDNLTENLFQTIQKLRTNKKHKLFKNYVLKSNPSKNLISAKKIISLAILSLVSVTVLSQIFVNYKTTRLLNPYLKVIEDN